MPDTTPPQCSRFVARALFVGATCLLLLVSLSAAPPHATPAAFNSIYQARTLWRDAYCLDSRASDVFMFHWFVLTVAGLFQLERPGHVVRLYAPWLAGSTAFKSYHNESIQMLAPEFEVIRSDPAAASVGMPGTEESCVKFGGLDVYHDDRPMPAEGLVWLREFFLAKVKRIAPIAPMDEHNLFYITRKGAGEGVADRISNPRRRNVDNEEAFVPALVNMGFKVIQLEHYSVEQKIRLFASARMVVSPQSASLTFSVFMNASADVVEIYPDVDILKQYCYLVRVAGCFWQRFTDVTTGGVDPASSRGNAAFNMLVHDPPALVAHIEHLLAHPSDRVRSTKCKAHPINFEDD